MLNLSEVEIQRLITSEDCPILLKVIGEALLGAKAINALEMILDRVLGKPIQERIIEVKEEKNLPFWLTTALNSDKV